MLQYDEWWERLQLFRGNKYNTVKRFSSLHGYPTGGEEGSGVDDDVVQDDYHISFSWKLFTGSPIWHKISQFNYISRRFSISSHSTDYQ